MARNRKNNHYHYAEKFEDMRRRQHRLFVPRKTAVVAALFLLIFGVISTTFSAYVSENVHPEEGGHTILVDIRTAKAQKDYAFTGAEADLAEIGADIASGTTIYFINPWSGTDLQILVGHSSWSVGYKLTRIGTTNLYYYTFSSAWGGYTEICFSTCGSSAWDGRSQKISDRISGASNYTATGGGGGLSNKVVFRAASSSNGAILSSNTGTDYGTTLNSTFNLYSYRKNGTGSYENNRSGGSVTASGTQKTTTNASSTQSTSVSTTVANSANPSTTVKIYPMAGSAVTLTNSPATGYKFDQYKFDGPNGTVAGSPVNMTSWGNENTHLYAFFSEVLHNVKIQTNIPGDTSSTTNTCVGVATAKSLSAPSRTGYTFTGWSTMPSGVTITSGSTSTSNITIKYSSSSTSADTVTLTANYRINPPTAVSINNQTTTVGASVSLNPTVTIDASGATAVNTYSVSPSSGASVTNAGVFSATKPGVYTVTLSSKASITSGGSTLTSTTSTTGTATITVKPATPSWSFTMSGYDASGDLDNGHTYGYDPDNPYLVTLGSTISFTASITNPSNDSNYVYTWYDGDDNVINTGSTLTFGSSTASEATLATVSVPAYCKVTYTGTDASVIYATTDTKTIYYYVKNLIKDFSIPKQQKIYNDDNDAKMHIEYEIPSGTGYTTELYASSDGVQYYSAASAAGFLGTQIGTSAVYELDPSANDGPMSKNGPKYFYVNMSKTGVNAKTDVIHTTVGADESSGTRQIYFINNTGLDLSTYRVMAFFVDGQGQAYYQTAQDVYKGITGKPQDIRYRVTIPSSATSISFGIAKSSRYAVPAYANDNFDYTMGKSDPDKNTYFVAYTPSLTTLDDDYNTINATAKTLVSGYTDTGNDPNPFYTLTTSYVAYQSAD
ncbi:MAG: hypothetical protein IJH40_11385 [Ruminococcus sp.]|uniref:Ig-like domain-containing protein n=1 Tax=Ruminococcus sp. TaxID=41978 RepID=UPI0028732BDA|nr:hypothetical protein [Ruminococcus sp.]MBQ3286223.1 hypothetical protein [Ruminococcus sp.]